VKNLRPEIVALALLLGSAPAFSQDQTPKVCQLGRVAALDLKTGGEGMIYVDGTVDGHRGNFLIDTGGMGLVLSMSTGFRLEASPQRAFMGGELVGGTKLDYGIAAKRLQIGNVTSTGPWFLLAPDHMFPSDAMGNIQPHALWPFYDVEIDFDQGKLNLFLTNQCPGHVVYWTHKAFAAVPMTVDSNGHITVQAMLDGKPVNTMLDTGAQNSMISLRAASHILDIDEKTSGVASLGAVVINNEVKAQRYRFPFKSLTIEGITINNPKIEIADTGSDSRKDPLLLGIGVLRQLHLFIAYDEGKLYLTGAEDQ
jgi:predicted aspartyl protease